jgi:hypothetical protein
MTDTAQRSEVCRTPSNDAPDDTISIDEIIERHRGEWVLMRVTENDEDGWPARGYLLEVAPTQGEVITALERWAHLAGDGNRWPFDTFLAEPLIKSGPEYATAVAEFFSGLIRAAGEHDARAGQ